MDSDFAENRLAASIGTGPDSINPVSGLESIDAVSDSVPLIIIAAVSMDAIIALPPALASLAASEGNTNGPGDGSCPIYENSSLDAYGKDIKNNNIAKIFIFWVPKLHTTFPYLYDNFNYI